MNQTKEKEEQETLIGGGKSEYDRHERIIAFFFITSTSLVYSLWSSLGAILT